MKKSLLFFLLFSCIIFTTRAQFPFKFDDQYKTLFAKDFCKLALTNPNLVLIDVRSPGEYSDTSQYNSLNMGQLKSAINIPIDTIEKNVSLMNAFKDKTIILYCSHSQRSRRVSKLLSENGFTDFYNLNGGMSQLNQLTEKEFPCKTEWLQSRLPYKNLSVTDAIGLLKKESNLFILDIRSEAKFNSQDSLIESNIGRIKKAVNIPYTNLKNRLPELNRYKQMPVFIYSERGDGDAARAAVLLTDKGFTNVYDLLTGLNDLLAEEGAEKFVDNTTPYHQVFSKGALTLLRNNKQLTIYDTRPAIEFTNKVTGRDSYKNTGNLKNAVNLQEKDFNQYSYPKDKAEPILICGREEAFKLANKLSGVGYKKVYVMSGMFDFMASAFNVEGSKDALQYLENHEGLY